MKNLTKTLLTATLILGLPLGAQRDRALRQSRADLLADCLGRMQCGHQSAPSSASPIWVSAVRARSARMSSDWTSICRLNSWYGAGP